MKKLTSRQERVLEFLERYIAEHRSAPLIREIQLACQVGSYKSIVDRLNALERKGFIKRTPHKHRGIRVVKNRLEPSVASAAALNAAALNASTVEDPA